MSPPITVKRFHSQELPQEFYSMNVTLLSGDTFFVRYQWSLCSKNSIMLLLKECQICRGTEAEVLNTPVFPPLSLSKNTATTVVPLSGLHLCRFLGAALHILLARVGNLLLLDGAWRIAGLGRLLIDLDRLGAVLLMVP